MSRFIRCTAALFVMLLSSAKATPAQEATHIPTITVNARLVVLDVVVTDRNGKPVDNLSQKDFQVFEDDQRQTIRTFEPPSAHLESASSVDASSPMTFDPAQPASFGVAPVTILVLDQLNTHFADSSYARHELQDYLARQPATLAYPTALLTVFDNNFKQLQGFTRDRDKLLQAIKASPTENAWKLELNGKADHGPADRLDQSLRALENIAQSYSGIRGRKNLIWVGGGFPSIDPATLDDKDAQEVKDDLEHITDLLLATRVTLYAVDPTSTAAGMTEITDESQLQFAMMAGDSLTGGADPFDINADFNKLAPVTGGRVIRGMNNVATQIANSIDLGANYYTLSYSPASVSPLPGQYRKIRVVCLRPDLKVFTRSGYYTENPQQEKSSGIVSYDLATAAESPIPLNAVHITVEPNHSVAAEEETYTVHVSAPSLTWVRAENGTSTAHVAIMAVSLSKQHKMIAHTLRGLTATARPGANLNDPGRTADFDLTVKPSGKATALRFIVRDAASGRMGSFDLPITR